MRFLWRIIRGARMSNQFITSLNDTATRLNWVSGPNTRGTFDIIWTSIFTIFLCTWSCLCLNIPPKGEHVVKRWIKKSLIAGLAIIGPEFVMGEAICQWLTVRRTIRGFHEAKYTQWSEEHGFFAEMGGFLLKTKGGFPVFPVNSSQVLYLLKKGVIEYPTVTKEAIRDKNKSDSLLRLITIVQVLWLLITTCCRAAQGLAISCLEITALAYLPCTLCTVFVWRKKGADVMDSCILETSMTILEIVQSDPKFGQVQSTLTPLDFVDRQEWESSLLWSHYQNILRHSGITLFLREPYPVKRLPNAGLRTPIKGRFFWFAIFITLAYCGVMFIPWDFSFPTRTEQLIWRYSAVAMVTAFVVWS